MNAAANKPSAPRRAATAGKATAKRAGKPAGTAAKKSTKKVTRSPAKGATDSAATAKKTPTVKKAPTKAKAPVAKKAVTAKKAATTSRSAAKSKPAAKATVKTPAKKSAKTAGKTTASKAAKATAARKAATTGRSAAQSKPAAKATGNKTPAKKAAAATQSTAEKAGKTPVQKATRRPAAKKNTGATKKKTVSSKPVKPLTPEQLRRAPQRDYMNEAQLEFFRQRLLAMRAEVIDREEATMEALGSTDTAADPADRATTEEERWLDLRLRERESMLLRKIDDALRRIDSGEYGYCLESGEPIGIERLLARPTAEYSIDAKNHSERLENRYGG